MTSEFDTVDRRIVTALQRDGRASVRDVAERIDVPATTVQKRLKRLHEENAITGYVPRIEYSQIGYEQTALIKLDVRPEAIESFIAGLRTEEQITSVYEVTGDFDVIAIVKCKDAGGMNEQIKALLTHPNVQTGNASVVRNIIKENSPPDVVGDKSKG